MAASLSSPNRGTIDATPARSADDADSERRRGTVEVIDDDEPLGTALAEGLVAHGYQAVYAADAAAAWELARRHAPDLILCDINMPGKNGHRLLRELRADPELADCQFVFMTGNTVYARPRTGMDLGADDFLLKPFTVDALVACVSARLQRATISRSREERAIGQLRASLRTTLPHEFFTPLSGIMGLTELLEEEQATMAPGEIVRVLHDIRRSSGRLHRTLRNYLKLLNLDDSAGSEGVPARVAASEVVEMLTAGAHAAAERHGRLDDLTLDLHGGDLIVDPADLALMVEELADNAFSFSPAGTAVRGSARPDGREFRLAIADAGRGMSPQQIGAVGAFHQFERKRFEQQGLGLGLELVRRLVRRYGGELQLQSEPGHGTTSRVTLPLAAS